MPNVAKVVRVSLVIRNQMEGSILISYLVAS